MGLPKEDEATEQRPCTVHAYPWAEANLISFVTHPGVGRVLCVGGGLTGGVKETLSGAGYEVGALPLSIANSSLPQAASTFLPDLIYVDLSEDEATALDVLGEFAADPRTQDLPVVALVALDAQELVIDDAYTRSGCDFFRVGHSSVELLARTNLLVRMARPANQLVAHRASPLPRAEAANDPGGGVDLLDGATGLYSPSYFMHRLPTEVSRARRYDRELSVIAIRCPAAHGDEATTVKIAGILRQHVRGPDVASQLEPDVFALLLPEAAPERLDTLRSRIRRELDDAELPHGFGVTGLDRDNTSSPAGLLNQAIELADVELSKAQ
ncbi:MAG: diguanylate cyclase [Myxococcales bacterium FL481]|nr:MAG: diguanylate cyclase [Myxococcales bacterium FL481]